MNFNFDIIVVGGGHAGCEASFISATMGMKTLLITMDMTKLAQMSCNPAMGGIAKGQIIREIDAMGGMSGIVTDRSMLQFRMLNKSKGPAMWSPRAQCDRQLFSNEWRHLLENTDNLFIWQEQINQLLIDGDRVIGVKTVFNNSFFSNAVILTTGTFLNGKMFVGLNQFEGGRSGDGQSTGITEQLCDLGFSVDRMKTGTSARIDGRSVHFDKMLEQKGDDDGSSFSYLHDNCFIDNPLSCYIIHTNRRTHEILADGLKYSPLYTNMIKGIGPRYCPSIETKIVTFKDKDSHQLFIEPEGFRTNEYYINGFSSSLPLDVQISALQTIEGLEDVVIHRPGYAIEYDFFQPTQLKHNLETKLVENLFFAGQINGTTGYEEAAAQGLMAGINATLKIRDNEECVLGREESYIGVLIDDLVMKGVDEPYRMFTARAEYRILLRQDNADERLTPIGKSIGSISHDRDLAFSNKREQVDALLQYVSNTSVDKSYINEFLTSKGSSPVSQKTKIKTIALRPAVSLKEFLQFLKSKTILAEDSFNNNRVVESVEIMIKYEGYIEREKIIAEKIRRLQDIRIGEEIQFKELLSISTEGRQKLEKIMPRTIGEASRIPGVSPSDINVLLMYLGR